ncbi:MAG: hypothetical protein P8J50_01080 [Acidimicrobiales bacterium]|nr:hypothetical protein [Acidimicrobiales bacterium]
MHERPDDEPETTSIPDEAAAPAAADPMLDAMETGLDAVASALDALDTDDLDAAERVVDGLAPTEEPAPVAAPAD